MSLQTQFRPMNPRLGTHYAILASVLTALLLVLALLEQLGVRKLWLSHIMILVPLLLYLGVSILTRTLDLHEFFSMSRRIPPVFGGLAFAITSMGGTGLVCITGTLYLMGFDALALSAGLIGGFALAAVLFVPFMRKAGAYTLSGFLNLRFNSPLVGAVAAVLTLPPSLILLAAELHIAGFVTSLFASVSFEMAVAFAALMIVVVLVLGGLRSLSWTQSVQYTVALAGLLVPLFIISAQETNLPLPQITYAWVLEQLSANELAAGVAATSPPPLLGGIPGERPEAAIKPFLQPFGALSRIDFTMLALCVLAGTAVLPALLLRSGSATNAQQSRRLMGWSAVFLGLFLISAPAYAVFAKHLTLAQITGADAGEMPAWISSLRGAGLADFSDRNGDGALAASELLISRDGVLLSLPIMAGLPFILVVFAATAGVAAALAAGAAHALAAGSSISNELYNGILNRHASHGKRVAVARAGIVISTIAAAWYVSINDFDVLRAMIAALSLAGASFLPVLMLAIFWKRVTKWGALAAMLTATAVAGGHMILQTSGAGFLWPGVSGLLGGVLGIPIGFAAGIAASLITPQPSPESAALVDDIRDPSGEALFDKAMRLAALRNRAEFPAPETGQEERKPDVPA